MTGMAALGVGQRPQIAEHPLLGVLPDGAGVHHHHVRPLGGCADGIAALAEVAPELFGVSLVLLAAVGFHIGHGGNAPLRPVGCNLIAAGKLCIQLLLRYNRCFCIHGKSPENNNFSTIDNTIFFGHFQAESYGFAGRLQNRTRHVGEALSLPKCTQLSRSLNGSSFPTQTVGADRIRPKLTKLSGWMNGKSVWLLPLGFPRGEAGFFGNRHFGTD